MTFMYLISLMVLNNCDFGAFIIFYIISRLTGFFLCVVRKVAFYCSC